MIYRWGRRGRGKGVMVEDGCVRESVEWGRGFYDVNEKDRIVEVF